jgi:hypothetical protein
MSTAVSTTVWTWFFSATAVLVAARLEALAVFAADFFASVVARLACVLDLLPFFVSAMRISTSSRLGLQGNGAQGSARV